MEVPLLPLAAGRLGWNGTSQRPGDLAGPDDEGSSPLASSSEPGIGTRAPFVCCERRRSGDPNPLQYPWSASSDAPRRTGSSGRHSGGTAECRRSAERNVRPATPFEWANSNSPHHGCDVTSYSSGCRVEKLDSKCEARLPFPLVADVPVEYHGFFVASEQKWATRDRRISTVTRPRPPGRSSRQSQGRCPCRRIPQ
jgi:hypothetical protein